MTDLRKAAEQALEALEGYPLPFQAPIKEALRQALAQPEQRPVAYEVDADVINSQGQSEYRTFLAYRPDPAMTTGGIYEVTKVLEARPLYTAPPKREWVGLTDADKQEAFDETQEASGGFWEFADYLEAKLKEKNGG